MEDFSPGDTLERGEPEDFSSVVPSNATTDEIETFTTGSCHWLSVALHRLHGWPILLVLDGEEMHWQDPVEDDGIPVVIHAYAISPDGMAWDVHGARPVGDVQDEAEQRWRVGAFATQILRDEADLADYVGCWGEDSEGEIIERPLPEYSEEDIEAVKAIIPRILPEALPETPVPRR